MINPFAKWTGTGVAQGLVYGGASGGLVFYLVGSAYNLFHPHAFDPSQFADGFGVTLGSVTASVVGHSRYMQNPAPGGGDAGNSQ